jgi:hypothetical protein
MRLNEHCGNGVHCPGETQEGHMEQDSTKSDMLLRPQWNLWALMAVIIGCLITIAATLNDIY